MKFSRNWSRYLQALDGDYFGQAKVVSAIDHPEAAFTDDLIDPILPVDGRSHPQEGILNHTLTSPD